MKKEQIFSRNPKVMNGALVFTGTRVPVEILIQHLTAGDSLNKFLADFPTVSQEQVVAYLERTLEVADACENFTKRLNKSYVIEGDLPDA